MPRHYLLLFIICLTVPYAQISGQTIKGDVTDISTHRPLQDVTVANIYTDVAVATAPDGKFLITASKGQLLEFKKLGYKTVHVRIPDGYVPEYFKIIMQEGVIEVPVPTVAHSNRYDYTYDSIRFHELYGHELGFARMNTFDVIEHPFSALSKKNREIWQFQDDFEREEKEKYIDRTFNPDLITNITGLKGDSLNYYMLHYRPAYWQLRNMNDYTLYNFIKSTVHQYRTRETPRNSG